jgi:hypothetical protein
MSKVSFNLVLWVERKFKRKGIEDLVSAGLSFLGSWGETFRSLASMREFTLFLWWCTVVVLESIFLE